MNIDGLRTLAFLATATCFAGTASAETEATAWDYSPVGQCIRRYLIPKPTVDYPLSIQQEKNVDSRNNRYVWIWDPTPSKNPTRQLVRVTPKNVGCTVLFMPNSEFHDFSLQRHGAMPDKVISTSATINDADGGHFYEQEYVLDKSRGFYQKIPNCYMVKNASKERKYVSCRAAVGE